MVFGNGFSNSFSYVGIMPNGVKCIVNDEQERLKHFSACSNAVTGSALVLVDGSELLRNAVDYVNSIFCNYRSKFGCLEFISDTIDAIHFINDDGVFTTKCRVVDRQDIYQVIAKHIVAAITDVTKELSNASSSTVHIVFDGCSHIISRIVTRAMEQTGNKVFNYATSVIERVDDSRTLDEITDDKDFKKLIASISAIEISAVLQKAVEGLIGSYDGIGAVDSLDSFENSCDGCDKIIAKYLECRDSYSSCLIMSSNNGLKVNGMKHSCNYREDDQIKFFLYDYENIYDIHATSRAIYDEYSAGYEYKKLVGPTEYFEHFEAAMLLLGNEELPPILGTEGKYMNIVKCLNGVLATRARMLSFNDGSSVQRTTISFEGFKDLVTAVNRMIEIKIAKDSRFGVIAKEAKATNVEKFLEYHTSPHGKGSKNADDICKKWIESFIWAATIKSGVATEFECYPIAPTISQLADYLQECRQDSFDPFSHRVNASYGNRSTPDVKTNNLIFLKLMCIENAAAKSMMELVSSKYNHGTKIIPNNYYHKPMYINFGNFRRASMSDVIKCYDMIAARSAAPIIAPIKTAPIIAPIKTAPAKADVSTKVLSHINCTCSRCTCNSDHGSISDVTVLDPNSLPGEYDKTHTCTIKIVKTDLSNNTRTCTTHVTVTTEIYNERTGCVDTVVEPTLTKITSWSLNSN